MIDVFHLSPDIPKNGTVPDWPWPTGHASRERVLFARNLTWAANAHAEKIEHLNDLRRREGSVRGANPAVLRLEQPKTSDDKLRTPQRARLQAVENLLPGTLQVYAHPLWLALDPKTDLHTCYQSKNALERRITDRLPLLLHEGRADEGAEVVGNLDGTALLVLWNRLFMAQGNGHAAFEIACCLIQALCFLAISRRYVSAMEAITEVVQRTALAGQSDRNFSITSDRAAFTATYEVLLFLVGEIDRVTGIGELRQREKHKWVTYVDLTRHLVKAIATPGGEAREAVLEAIAYAYGREGQRKAEALARVPIFLKATGA